MKKPKITKSTETSEDIPDITTTSADLPTAQEDMPRVTLPRNINVLPRSFSTIANEKPLVTLEKHGRVGIMKFNDPDRLNALTSEMGMRVQGNSR